jgi:alkylation response protein AidB-like acyl-CoA dehydrogenase
MVYRTLGLLEASAGAIDSNNSEAWLREMDEYAAECSIVKVALTEYCNYVADEMVQIYGGYGFLADYPAERAYRDSRLKRIGEGTNEINRLLISSRLIKFANRECQPLAEEAGSPNSPNHEETLLRRAKQAALTSLRMAAQMNKLTLAEQQAIMIGIADIIIDTYAMESAILRTQKAGAPSSYVDMTQVFCADASQRIEANLKHTIAALDGRGPVILRQRHCQGQLSSEGKVNENLR